MALNDGWAGRIRLYYRHKQGTAANCMVDNGHPAGLHLHARAAVFFPGKTSQAWMINSNPDERAGIAGEPLAWIEGQGTVKLQDQTIIVQWD